jgi:hypothetical protein
MPQPDAEQRSRRSRVAHITLRVLSHPLMLLLVGAVVSSILIPLYTRQAQEHKEALEVKRALAERITNAVSPFLAATLANELVARGRPTVTYDRAYESWTTESNAVLTEMRAYYSDGRLAEEWLDLSYRIKWLYYFFKAGAYPYQSRLFVLRQYLRPLIASCACGTIQFEPLARFSIPPRGVNPELDRNLQGLLAAFRQRADAIVGDVLSSSPRL